MRVLWVSAGTNGPAADILGLSYAGSSGGWITATYEQMKKDKKFEDIEMFYLCSSKLIKKNQIIKSTKNNETAYCVRMNRIPFGVKPKKHQIKQFMHIIDEIKPDIINIWGTELTINYLAVIASKDIPCAIYFQGVLGIHVKYLGGYIKQLGDTKYYGLIGTLRSLKGKLKEKYFRRQVRFEHEMISRGKNIITDNEFVKNYVGSINETCKAFLSPYELNSVFSKYDWSLEKSVPNTIFTVYGVSPDKGLSQLLKALVIVKKTHPNVVLSLPGTYHSIGKKSLRKSFKMSSFEIWIENFILKNDLNNNVKFLGKLTAVEMAEQLQKCAVFVNPSIMENTATALREALTVGVPSITTLCGSICEFITHNENALLYRYEEHEILAAYIIKILDDDMLATKLSNNAKIRAKTDLNSKEYASLINVYEEIIKGR